MTITFTGQVTKPSHTGFPLLKYILFEIMYKALVRFIFLSTQKLFKHREYPILF